MKRAKQLIYIAIISLLFFIGIISSISFNLAITSLDKPINSIMPLIENINLVEISKIIGILFDTITLVIISLIISIYLWFKKNKKESIFLSISMIIGAGAIYLLKEIIQRPRPLNSLITETGFSFPSGHAVISVIFIGLLSYIFASRAKSNKFKIILGLFSVLIILIIGLSRLLLNVHWLSDVLGGFCLGSFLLASNILFKEFLEKKKYQES